MIGRLIRFSGDDIDNARRRTVLHDRNGDRRDGNTENRARFFIGLIEIGVLFVELGYVQCARLVHMLQIQPRLLRADGDAALRADDDKRRFRYAERLGHFTDEIEKAGRVQHVYLITADLDRADGSLNRYYPFDLFRVVIGNRISVRHLSQTVCHLVGI